MSKILIIVPALNEEKNIGSVIKEISECGLPVDTVVVNDGSTDNTEHVARANGAVVLSLPYNLGIGGAVQTGFKYAVEYGYDIAIQIDADGQHIASELQLLVKPVEEEKADVVIGSRFLVQNGYKSSFSRKLGITIFSIINSILIRKKITDNTSGFRAYNKKAIKFLSINYPSDYPEPEAVISLTKNNFNIMEVPVKMRQRQFGDSSINAIKSIYYMIKVVLAIVIGVFKKRERVL